MTENERTLDDVYREMKNGDLGYDEAVKEANTITANNINRKVTENIQTTLAQALQERDNAKAVKRFMTDHPDFKELQESGALEKIKSVNPMHDDFSAYFAHQAEQPVETESMPENTEEPKRGPLKGQALRESMLEAYRNAEK